MISKYSKHGISPELESCRESSLGGLAVGLGPVDSRQLPSPKPWRDMVAAAGPCSGFQKGNHKPGPLGSGKATESSPKVVLMIKGGEPSALILKSECNDIE